MITDIKVKNEKWGVVLAIESNDIIPTIREECISSSFENEIPDKFIDQINAISVDCCRYKGMNDVEIAKYFIDSLLTESEIDQLINQLKN